MTSTRSRAEVLGDAALAEQSRLIQVQRAAKRNSYRMTPRRAFAWSAYLVTSAALCAAAIKFWIGPSFFWWQFAVGCGIGVLGVYAGIAVESESERESGVFKRRVYEGGPVEASLVCAGFGLALGALGAGVLLNVAG
jgi:hypothetical protein